MRTVHDFKIDLDTTRIDEVWTEVSSIAGQLNALVIERSGTVRRIENPTLSALVNNSQPVRLSGFTAENSKIQELARMILHAATGGHRPVFSLSLFLSPKGAITPPHFDMPAVAVCQIEGQKLLQVQAHSRCINPKSDELINEPGLSYEIERLLSAGDGILIPPGHVHTTMATTQGCTLGVGFLEA